MQQGPSGQDIRSATFPIEKRRGYQAQAVERYLALVADHVDALQGQLDAHAHSEHSAMLLLQQARQTAEQTMAEATEQADTLRSDALEESRRTIESSRAEARQRMDGAEAQIEAAFAEAAARLNELEREIQGRRRELAMLEAASARFAADQAARMREQADVLLGAAESISSAASPEAVDADLVGDAALTGDAVPTIDLTAAGPPTVDPAASTGTALAEPGPTGPPPAGPAGSPDRAEPAGSTDAGAAPDASGRIGTNGLFTT